MKEKVEPNFGHGIAGWKQRQEASRRRLSKSAEERAEIRRIRREHKLGVQAEQPEQTEQPAEQPATEVEIVPHPGGWYTVEADGKPITDSKVRKDKAEEIAEAYRNG